MLVVSMAVAATMFCAICCVAACSCAEAAAATAAGDMVADVSPAGTVTPLSVATPLACVGDRGALLVVLELLLIAGAVELAGADSEPLFAANAAAVIAELVLLTLGTKMAASLCNFPCSINGQITKRAVTGFSLKSTNWCSAS